MQIRGCLSRSSQLVHQIIEARRARTVILLLMDQPKKIPSCILFGIIRKLRRRQTAGTSAGFKQKNKCNAVQFCTIVSIIPSEKFAHTNQSDIFLLLHPGNKILVSASKRNYYYVFRCHTEHGAMRCALIIDNLRRTHWQNKKCERLLSAQGRESVMPSNHF